MNAEKLYTVLLTSGGAVVETEYPMGWYASRRHEPAMIALPRLPHTSAVWVDHEVDSDGRLVRVVRESPALAVRVDSLPGGVAETGDGTPEHPFVNLNSVRERFNDCLIRALGCAGAVISVTVTGTVDYELSLTGGAAGDTAVYDFTGAEVGGSALVECQGSGTRVVRGLQGPYSIFGGTVNGTVYNDCSWWGPPPVERSRLMRRAVGCAFDRCDFSADRSFFGSFVSCTVAGGSFCVSGAPPFSGISRCVVSGSVISGGLAGDERTAWGAVVNARESVFEECSVSLRCNVRVSNDDQGGSWYLDAYAGAVTSCSACAFDRCSASVTVVSGGFHHLCFQGCGFYLNSNSVFAHCSGNYVAEGYCTHSGFRAIGCDQ